MKYMTGFMAGALLVCCLQANAGVISHVAAYEYGKHVARKEAKDDCTCPDQRR